MPRKSVTVKDKEIRITEVYFVNVACPYCKTPLVIEEEYEMPAEDWCYKCGKTFSIKVSKAKKAKPKKP